jgi:hypothetical protein
VQRVRVQNRFAAGRFWCVFAKGSVSCIAKRPSGPGFCKKDIVKIGPRCHPPKHPRRRRRAPRCRRRHHLAAAPQARRRRQVMMVPSPPPPGPDIVAAAPNTTTSDYFVLLVRIVADIAVRTALRVSTSPTPAHGPTGRPQAPPRRQRPLPAPDLTVAAPNHLHRPFAKLRTAPSAPSSSARRWLCSTAIPSAYPALTQRLPPA